MLLCSSSSAPRTSSLLAKGLDWTEAVLGALWSWAQSFKAPHSHHLEVPTADQQLPNLPSIPAPTLHREQQSPPIPASYYQPGSSPLTSIAMETEYCHPHVLEAASHSSSPPRTTPHLLPCPKPSPTALPLLLPPSSQTNPETRERNRPRQFFFSSNRKIYFNCCNTVDYKRLLCMTEHSTGCIYVGLLVPGASRWLLCSPLLARLFPATLLPDGDSNGFFTLEGRAGLAASTRKDKGELSWLRGTAQSCFTNLTPQSMRACSWVTLTLDCQPSSPTTFKRWELKQLSCPLAGGLIMSVPFYIYKYIRISPLPPQHIPHALPRWQSQDSIQLTAQMQDRFTLEGRKQSIPTERTYKVWRLCTDSVFLRTNHYLHDNGTVLGYVPQY